MLYPELDRAHPLIMTSDIDFGASGDIVEYRQFGPTLFISGNNLDNPIRVNTEISILMKMFLLGSSIRTRKYATPPANVPMDWPYLKYTLRSHEAMLDM